jgi:membrane-associated phospholipid phosphatase
MSAPPPPPESPAVEEGAGPLVGAALAAGLAVAGLAMVLFVWLGEEVLEGETRAVDLWVRTLIHAHAGPGLTAVMLAASRWGAPRVLAIFGAVAALVFLTRAWRRAAVMLLIVMAGAGILDVLLKQLYARARPLPLFDFYPSPRSYSFPSGHALFAACFFGGVAVLASHRVHRPAARIAIWLAAVVLVGLIGISRIYLGVHYPSDVLGGLAAGAVWVATVALGDRLAEHRRRRVRRA